MADLEITKTGPAAKYVQAARQHRDVAVLQALQKLVDIQVCARCCLRFAGVRSSVYAEQAPSQLELSAAVQSSQGSTADPACNGNGAQPDQDAAAACPPCPVCLGMLQCPEGRSAPSTAAPEAAAAVQSDPESQDWAAVAGPAMAGAADVVRQQGFEFSSFAVDLSVPGATLVRQQAVWHWLRRDPAVKMLFPGHSPACDVVDLKEALRLALVEPLAEQLHCRHRPDAEVHVGLMWAHPASAKEADFLFGGSGKAKGRGAKRRRGPEQPLQQGRMASEALAQMAAKMLEAKLGAHARIPPLPPAAPAQLLVRTRRDAVWVGGYYRKLNREVSNSAFFLEGVRLGKTSVAEEIERVVAPQYRCEGTKFSSAGREDLDVRMLGSGRPFVLEIVNAKAEVPPAEAFRDMQEAINALGTGVEVRKLQPVTRATVQLIKDGEQEKQKSYEARCRLPCAVTAKHLEQLNATKDLMLHQRTPTRVEHRRAMLVRERKVHSIEAMPVEGDPNGLVLRLRTQAGTYIKEFVHGDDGRTVPNLGSLLGCDTPGVILELDVLEVHMEFLP